MRRPVLGVLLGLALAPGAVRAQEKPVDPGSLDAGPAPVAFAFGEDPARALHINGFGVATYAYDLNTDENSFADSAFALSLSKLLTDQVSAFAQVTVAREATSPFRGQEGNFEHDVSTDIDNLQLAWVPSPASGLEFTLGKFDSPLAIERDDAPLDFQATHSFTFDFARPVKFTGLQAHESFSGNLEAWAIFGNGWDNDTDNNKAKTGAIYALWNPSLRYHFGLGVIEGGEKDGQTGDARTTAVATILMQPSDSWVYGEEFVGGREPHAADDGGTARWFADMFFLHHRFGRHWAGTFRAEYFDDVGGSRTGTRQILRSVTLSPQYLVGGGFYGLYRNLEHTSLRLPELALRLDLRWDHSSEPVFRARKAGVGRRDAYSTTLQTVFLF